MKASRIEPFLIPDNKYKQLFTLKQILLQVLTRLIKLYSGPCI